APAQPGARRRGWARGRAWQAAAAVLLIAGGATAVTMVARTRGAAAPAVRVAASADSRAADSADPSHAQTLMIGEGYSELTDAQLQALLDDVKKLDPMPSADPDVTPQITPLSQNGGA
ncbi:MAG TPA: hypothetical protein VG818_12670, partial [Gemmatimonadaceae bacterium]|nr:hypothetical protein [Gemmatimonadaceae bacterium]